MAKVFIYTGINIREFLNKGSAYVRNVGTQPVNTDLRLIRLEGRFQQVCKCGAERFCGKMQCKNCKVLQTYETVKLNIEIEKAVKTAMVTKTVSIPTIMISDCTNCNITINGEIHKTWDMPST